MFVALTCVLLRVFFTPMLLLLYIFVFLTLDLCSLQYVKFGSLDYSNEDAVTIDITLRYDWAETSDKPEIQA